MTINREVPGTINVGDPIQDPSLKRIELMRGGRRVKRRLGCCGTKVCVIMKKQCSDLNAEYGREVISNQTELAREISARLNVAGAESKLDATFDAASVSCALKWFYSGPAARTSDGWQLPHLR